jgi:hypothetical protein
VTTLEHWPDRRSWGCRACGEPWPCDQARKNLADDPTVAIYMSIQLHVAMLELPTARPREMYERFIAWTWQTL